MIGGIIATSLLVGSVTGVLAPSPFQSSVRTLSRLVGFCF
jgi:hypothetical protein